jgi:glycosyltransferase involved in cell wall biosynthesis
MNPELSIIVPVYNEARTLEKIMEAISKACPNAQIIYVDDGSKDVSLTLLKAHARPADMVLTKPNGGKGSAIRMGLEHAIGAYTVIQDADLEYIPEEISLLMYEAKKNPGAAIFGSRFFHGKTPHIYWRFLMGNKVMTAWMNILFFANLTDTYTCYKLLPTPLFQSLKLQSGGFEMEAEITARCLRRHIKIIEVPISYHPRSIEEGKKINWKDAVKGALKMVKVRFE